jgi:uncharacterized membrane protein
VLSRSIFWPWFAGLAILIAGLLTRRRELAKARGLDELVVLGPVFMAAGIAVFGGEHLASPRVLMQIVPVWMPARLFWAYFVGVALIAAALSFVTMKYVRWSATLLGVMFLLFVLMIHAPNVVTNPKDRFLWTVALREIAFAGGAWALAGRRLAIVSRFLVAIPLIFFAAEHFLHPEFAPGVPLSKLTPAWVPARPLWGYLTGAVLLVAGMALLATQRSRFAVTCAGLVLTLLTLFLYAPILAMASQPAQITEALNYVGDTLLFAGAVLCEAHAVGSIRRIVKS